MSAPAPAGRVVLLATEGASTRIVYHALARRFPDVRVVLEEPVSRASLLRRRRERLGTVTVLGQILFMGVAAPLLRRRAVQRAAEIAAAAGLDTSPLPTSAHRVSSVNSAEAREALRSLAPSVVVVNGTRIISRETLRAVAAPFVNMHMGITPLYRGVHGGYWAVAEGRPELAGTTVHLVDEGIDTGTIVAQATFPVGPEDSFATYPYLHLAAGIPLLLEAVDDALRGTLRTRGAPSGLASRLRSHPTLWGYLAGRFLRGAR